MNSPFESGECGKDGKQTVKHVAGGGKYFPVRPAPYARAKNDGMRRCDRIAAETKNDHAK
jgi:hypothetical protein